VYKLKDVIKLWQQIVYLNYKTEYNYSYYHLYISYRLINFNFKIIKEHLFKSDIYSKVIIDAIQKFKFIRTKLPESTLHLKVIYLDLLKLKYNKFKLTISKIDHTNILKFLDDSYNFQFDVKTFIGHSPTEHQGSASGSVPIHTVYYNSKHIHKYIISNLVNFIRDIPIEILKRDNIFIANLNNVLEHIERGYYDHHGFHLKI
jgi:hypothetical protein